MVVYMYCLAVMDTDWKRALRTEKEGESKILKKNKQTNKNEINWK